MSDLNNLIAAADRDQRIKKERIHIGKPEGLKAHRQNKSTLLWILLSGFIVVVFFILLQPLFPVSRDVIQKELTTTLDAAQNAVEEYYKVNEVFPSQVPDTALVGLVQYEMLDNGYRLRISMNGMTLTRER